MLPKPCISRDFLLTCLKNSSRQVNFLVPLSASTWLCSVWPSLSFYAVSAFPRTRFLCRVSVASSHLVLVTGPASSPWGSPPRFLGLTDTQDHLRVKTCVQSAFPLLPQPWPLGTPHLWWCLSEEPDHFSRPVWELAGRGVLWHQAYL